MFKQLIKKDSVRIFLIAVIAFCAYKMYKKSKNVENFSSLYQEGKRCFRKSCSICRVGTIREGDFKPCCYSVEVDCNADNLLL